jgi:hypothetical protein
MRQKLGIAAGLVVLILILIGLNAATYVQREKTPDNEIVPNRSSFNSGATGTQALYTLLAETGRKVTRWQSPIDELRSEVRNPPSTFVVIGKTRRPFDEVEIRQLLNWVDEGGRLVFIGRELDEEFLKAIAGWEFTYKTNELELLIGSDPSDQQQMTGGMPASRPVQPTVFTERVNAVQTSKFASHIEILRKAAGEDAVRGYGSYQLTGQTQPTPIDFYQASPSPNPTTTDETGSDEYEAPAPPPAPAEVPNSITSIQGDELAGDEGFSAPVVHLIGNQRNVLVDIPYGAGEIVLLSDPYIVSNSGVGLVDNAQLAINVLTEGGGLIAFDEFHQGYGSNQNRFFGYFAGTPVIAIFGQIALVAFLVFLSRSRRFARPVPEPEPDRRTKLEYVGAMAELQQRTRAYDLALENIYGDFRRRVSSLFGVDMTLTSRRQLSQLIADRIKGDAAEIESVMQKCQDIIHGEATSKKETIALASRLREIETELGMVRSAHRRTVR